MRTYLTLLMALAVSSASLLAQPPRIVSATRVSSDKVRVTFDVPVTPAGISNLLTDDFSSTAIDPARWSVNETGFEGGSATAESSVEIVDGQLVIEVEGEGSGWGGRSIRSTATYQASASAPLIFEIDRVAHDEDASASRTGIWITDASRSRYVLFAEADGEGGWQYNRLTGDLSDNPSGPGAITPLVNQEEFSDLGNHRLRAILDGTTVRLYLDGQFATEVGFELSSGIVFEVGAYAAEAEDVVTGIFDNARIATLTPVTLSNFTLDNGALVTAVTTTSDPRILELTTTGMVAGTDYTLTISGVESESGEPIAPNSTIAVAAGPGGSAYAEAVLADKPVAYYRMDLNAGNAVPNAAASGAAAVYPEGTRPAITRGPAIPEFPGFGAGNTGALFDGVGTYTDSEGTVQLIGVGNYIDTGAPLLQDLPAFTIEVWIRPAYLDESRLGIAGTFGTEFGFNAPGELHIYTGGGGIIYAPYPFRYHEWHHIVVTGDGTNLTMYADGEQIAQVNDETDGYGGEERNVFIGGGGIFDEVEVDGFGNWFPGGIDEVAIYDKALSAERVRAHFQAAYAAHLRPMVSITSPLENATINPGAAVPITLAVSAAEGRTVSRVEFFDRNLLLGEATEAPFSFTVSSISEGRHTLMARAYDDLGVSSDSQPVSFIVGEAKPLVVMVVSSTDNLTESDEAVRDYLLEKDLDVQLVPASDLSASAVTDASLVIVPVVRADPVAELLRELPVPIITWDQDLQPTFLFVEDEVDVFWGDTSPDLFINIVDDSHPLAAGFPVDVLQVNEYAQEFAWGVPGEEAIIIATRPDVTDHAVIYAYDRGAALIDGSEAPEKRVFFMLTDDTFLALTDDGLALFDAAIAWASRTVEAAPRMNPPTVEAGGIVISWAGGGTLESAPSLEGPWTEVTGASSPHMVQAGDQPVQFFRIRR